MNADLKTFINMISAFGLISGLSFDHINFVTGMDVTHGFLF